MKIAINEKGIIKGFSDVSIEKKFQELGVFPGETIKITHIALFDDPIIISTSNTEIAIRKAELLKIIVT